MISCLRHLPNRNGSLMSTMTIGSLLLFAAIPVRGILQDDCLYHGTDILEDSEVVYVVNKPWLEGQILSKGGRPLADRHKHAVFGRKGKCYISRGEIREDRFIETKRKKIACIKYLELWKTLEELGIWASQSMTPDTLLEKIEGKTPEEAEKIVFEMYESLELDRDTLYFTIRVKNLEHKFMVWDIENLRDKSYLKIRKAIDILVFGAGK